MPGGTSICGSRGLKNASAWARAASGEVRISLTVLFLFSKTGSSEKGSTGFLRKAGARTGAAARACPARQRDGRIREDDQAVEAPIEHVLLALGISPKPRGKIPPTASMQDAARIAPAACGRATGPS